jgi:hypothetical protein
MRQDGRFTPGSEALGIIAELRWHGHDTAATRLSQLVLERIPSGLTLLERLQYLVFAGDFDAAAAAGDSLLLVVPKDPKNNVDFNFFRDVLYWAAVVAVVRDDHARANALMQRLEQNRWRYDRGRTSVQVGRILALMGEKDRAVQMLQRAYGEGSSNGYAGNTFHAQYGFEPLRGFAPFEAFAKPKK